MDVVMSDALPPQAQQGTKRTLSGSMRPKHATPASHQPSAGPQPGPSSTPTLLHDQSPITAEVFAHIDAIKHIDDKLIFELLRSARFYSNISAGSSSVPSQDSSRRSSQVPSLCSDNRSSVASSAMFSLFSKPSHTSLRSASNSSAKSGLSRSKSHAELRTPRHASSRSEATESSASSASTGRSRSVRHDSVAVEKPLPPVPAKHSHAQSMPHVTQQPKSYACTYCDQTFKHRSYWMIHEEELHEQPKRWTCPDCYRSFFAEKKYRKHHFESHACNHCGMKKEAEKNLNATERCSMQGVIEGKEGKPVRSQTCAEKNFLRMHNKRAYGCGFCINLCRSWSERCEHISRHYDAGATKSDWCFSNVVKSLMLQSELAIAWEKLMSKEHGSDRAYWPSFDWDKREARDLVRSMEQNGMVHEKVRGIVQTAYDLAHPQDTSAPEDAALSADEETAAEHPENQQPNTTANSTPAAPPSDSKHHSFQTEQQHQTPGSEQRHFSTPSLAHSSTLSMSSEPPPAYTSCPQRASKELELLSQAIDEHLATSGPFVVDFDFNPSWGPDDATTPQLHQQDDNTDQDIVAFTHPGAYAAYTAANQHHHRGKNDWLS